MADDEYERERQENIKRNRELLLSLGLNPAISGDSNRKAGGPSSSRRTAPSGQQQQQQRKRQRVARASEGDEDGDAAFPETRRSLRPRIPKPKVTVTYTHPDAVRKSSRLSGQTAVSYNEDDRANENRYVSPPLRLKKLRNPSPLISADDENGVIRELDKVGLPTRDARGNVIFENNNRHFMPNLTPAEMIAGGMFGGTALRPYWSRVARQQLDPNVEMTEWPSDWLNDVDVEDMLTNEEYRVHRNRYGVKASQSLEEWETAGWIRAQDPRGWWQWYFRFYLGRRTTDDARQIGRWLKACGPAGRFKRSLVTKVHQSGSTWDDETVAPVVRQILFHWAYALTEHDYQAYLP